MADVAHEAGVSVASVSNFLNKQPYMSEAMAARIAEAIDRLGYKVNSSARNLRSGRTRLLKLVIPDLRQVYFSELAEDILAEARQHGYGVIVESTTNNRARELESIASMGTHSADGLILAPQIGFLLGCGNPLVLPFLALFQRFLASFAERGVLPNDSR